MSETAEKLRIMSDNLGNSFFAEAADEMEQQAARISELEATIREQAMQYLTVSGEAEELYGERKAVVRWLRAADKSDHPADLADAIERGDHQRGDSH